MENKFRSKNVIFGIFSRHTFPIKDPTSSLEMLLTYALCLKTRRMLLFIRESQASQAASLRLLYDKRNKITTKTLLSQNPKDTIHFLRMCSSSDQTVHILKKQFGRTSRDDAAKILKAPENKVP